MGHSAQSLGELELLRQLTALGLEPLTQARVCRQRRWRYDFGLPEYRLLIEADGRGHFSPKKLAEAAERDGWVSANFPEWRILRVPTPELSSGTAIRRIQGAIADYQRRQQTVPLQLPVKITPSHDRQGEAATNVGQLPVLPSGVRLVGWEPKAAPVRLSECSIVTNPELFVQSTLRQLDAHLKGKDRLAGGWGLSGLLARLEACGCVVALDGASGRPMACPQVASNGFPLRRYPQHVLGHCAGARLH